MRREPCEANRVPGVRNKGIGQHPGGDLPHGHADTRGNRRYRRSPSRSEQPHMGRGCRARCLTGYLYGPADHLRLFGGETHSMLIRGGTVVLPDGAAPADILIDGEMLVEIGRDLPGEADEIDATGLHVLPGVIDV